MFDWRPKQIRNYLVYRERPYLPSSYHSPLVAELAGTDTAWRGLEKIIKDIILRFGLKTNSAIEFGVEYGYSTSVFANYFAEVRGIDTFTGDVHSSIRSDYYELTKRNLSGFSNIQLIKSDYREYIANPEYGNRQYDMAHVDIIHTFDDTYKCGLWAAQHAKCVLFHDTESFPEVKKAAAKIAKMTGRRFYNYAHCNGLGIVV